MKYLIILLSLFTIASCNYKAVTKNDGETKIDTLWCDYDERLDSIVTLDTSDYQEPEAEEFHSTFNFVLINSPENKNVANDIVQSLNFLDSTFIKKGIFSHFNEAFVFDSEKYTFNSIYNDFALETELTSQYINPNVTTVFVLPGDPICETTDQGNEYCYFVLGYAYPVSKENLPRINEIAYHNYIIMTYEGLANHKTLAHEWCHYQGEGHIPGQCCNLMNPTYNPESTEVTDEQINRICVVIDNR